MRVARGSARLSQAWCPQQGFRFLPAGCSDHLGAASSAAGLRLAGASPRPCSLLGAAWWTAVVHPLSRDSACRRSPGGPRPSALPPVPASGLAGSRMNRSGVTGVRGQVGGHGSQRTGWTHLPSAQGLRGGLEGLAGPCVSTESQCARLAGCGTTIITVLREVSDFFI